MLSFERQCWRRMLKIGGRAPNDVIYVFTNTGSILDSVRVNRVSLLLRLINSPVNSWQHAALVVQIELNTSWFKTAYDDLRLIFPALVLKVSAHTVGPCVVSSAWWSEEGAWISAQAPQLPVDIMTGLRGRIATPTSRTDYIERHVRRHIHFTCASLRDHCSRQLASDVFWRIQAHSLVNPRSKLALMAWFLQLGAVPLHVALNWIIQPSHRAAVASFFSGDWGLGQYSANYFAKSLLPRSRIKRAALASEGVDPDCICLSCWIWRDIAVLENSAHVIIDCPAYAQCRSSLLESLTPELQARLIAARTSEAKLATLLTSHSSHDWVQFGAFLNSARRQRRRTRISIDRLSSQLERDRFMTKKAAWRAKGRTVCRHGMFFKVGGRAECHCMNMSSESRPPRCDDIALMPVLSVTLKEIVVAPFNAQTVKRLGELRAELRRRAW